VGASQGGYCAPALASRHPDVFGAAIAFSGYYHAGRLGPPTTLPFGKDKDFIDAASPDVLITRMPPAVRASQYYILVAKLDQSLYGPEATRFASILWAYDVPHLLLSSTTPHGWRQMKYEFQRAMEAWGARMVLTGVFDIH
jgi:predicted esterase